MDNESDVLLAHIAENVEEVFDHVTRPADTLDDRALYAVRSVLQDCRSVLDWLAHEIDQKHGAAKRRSPYYPFCETAENLIKQFDRDFLGVRAAQPELFEAIARHQPFARDHGNLRYLPQLSNVEKHQHFSRQTFEVTRNFVGGGLMRRMPNGSLRIGAPPPIGVLTGQAATDADGNVLAGFGVLEEWYFDDPRVPVAWTLQRIAQNVQDTHTDVSTWL